ncbi:MAG: 50S ribosomal protein L14e [Candidatus Bathyarchaeota archaeon]|nr:50S ribosomal protein L14e [Candidatus Bathyarchaeota archaeon]
MPAVEVGRVCVKLAGREAGSKCVVVDVIDKNFVLVTGPVKVSGVKRRRVNVSHVEPMDAKVKIEKGADDAVVVDALTKAKLLEEMKKPVKPTL